MTPLCPAYRSRYDDRVVSPEDQTELNQTKENQTEENQTGEKDEPAKEKWVAL